MRSDPHVDDFARLIRGELPALLAYACSLTRNTSDAEDLVQETCLAACEARDAYDPARPLGSWLRGILRHKRIDALRRRREKPLDSAMLEAIEDIHDDLDQRAAQDDLYETLEHCLGRLTAALRRLLERHHGDGVSVATLAAELAIEADAIKKRLQRARALLIACLTGRGFPVTGPAPHTNSKGPPHGP